MRIKVFLLLGLLFTMSAFAQKAWDLNLPAWTDQTPQAPVGSKFRYEVTIGIGDSERAAENDAWAKMYKLIIDMNQHAFNSAAVFAAVQRGVEYDVINNEYQVCVNKSCERSRYDKVKKQYYHYLLCQIPRKLEGGFDPDNFTDDYAACDSMPKSPYHIGYAFVPGMAQIEKGSRVKGGVFIAGEVVFAAGIVVSECLRQSYINKINSTHNTQLRMQYIKNANACGIARNISIAGVAAVYVWNVIDGIVAKAPIQMGNTAMRFAPYADFESAGLAFQCNF